MAHSVGMGLVRLSLSTLLRGNFGIRWRSVLIALVSCGAGLGTIAPVHALPGYSTRDAQAWIQAHPTLQPAPGERLVVRKSDTAAQRFTFEASIFPPYSFRQPRGSRIIRQETIELFDMINGVTVSRLEESLRVIFGQDIYQDYAQAQTVYTYPPDPSLDRLQAQMTPIQRARRGQLRLGDRFGYWLELVQTPEGRPYNGQVVVFLKDDLTELEAQLRQ